MIIPFIFLNTARYSALASFEPDFPLEPVNLLNTTPEPRNDELLFLNTSEYNGSKAALTSDDNILECARHLLSLSSL